MIYEWLMVICLYFYVASSLGKALPLWRRRRRINLTGTRAERDEATFAAYAATWSTMVIGRHAVAVLLEARRVHGRRAAAEGSDRRARAASDVPARRVRRRGAQPLNHNTYILRAASS